MHIKDKVCVVTGGASGIGEAVARAYAAAGARGVVVADLRTSRDRLAKVAGEIDGLAVTCDVGQEEDIKALIAAAEDKYGPVDVFFSNAGLSRKGQEAASDADWEVSWRVHVMSHVFAARALVPGMLARGSGYLLNTASAAGLLASLNSMPYGVTKHAAVALAEHLAIQYGDRGIRVSVLCPQSVQTGMTTPGPSAARVDGVLQAPEVARMVIEAMEAERFLILSHPQVHDYMQRKAANAERWLAGMRRLRDRIYGGQCRHYETDAPHSPSLRAKRSSTRFFLCAARLDCFDFAAMTAYVSDVGANGLSIPEYCFGAGKAYAPRREVLSFKPTRASACLTAAATPSITGTPNFCDSAAARSAIPAHPSTMASAPLSSASAISASSLTAAPEPGFSRSSTATLHALTRARSAKP